MNSFLQRIGRGNRKNERIEVLLCAENDTQRLIQKAMLLCAQNGILLNTAVGNIFHVIIQQIISYIFQSKDFKRSKDALKSLIESCLKYYFEDLSVANDIINNLILSSQLKEADDGKLTVKNDWFDKFSNGQIHSTIRFASGMSIYDLEKNKVLATNVQDFQNKRIKITGQNKEIIDIQGNSLIVKNSSEKLDGGLLSYAPYETIFFNTQPYAIRTYLGLEDKVFPYIIRDNMVYVFHLGSTQREFFIKLLIRMLDLKAIEAVNPFLVQFNKSYCNKVISSLKDLNYYSMIEFIEKDIEWIEKALKINPHNKLLPMKIRLKEIVRIINLENEIKLFKKAEFQNVTHTQLEMYLAKLIH